MAPGMETEPTRDAAGPPAGYAATDVTHAASALCGGAWNLPGRMLPMVYALVVSVFAARILGPDAMGRLTLVAFVATSLAFVATAGVNTAVVQQVGVSLGRGRASAVRGVLTWAWRIELTLAVLAALALAAAAALGAEPRTGWLLGALTCALVIAHSVPSGLLMGAHRWRDAVVVGVVTGSLHTAVAVTVLLTGGGVVELLALDAGAALVNLAWTTTLARRRLAQMGALHGPTDPPPPGVGRFALASTFALALAFAVERRSEIAFLAWFSTDAQIAIYSIPFSALVLAMLVPNAIAIVAFPAFAALHGAAAPARIRSGFARVVRLTLYLVVPLTAAGIALGPETIGVVYGDEYSDSRPVLVVLVAALPLVAVAVLSLALLQALGRAQAQLVVFGTAAAANAALNLFLVPGFDAMGAAFAHVGGRLVATALLVRAVRHALGSVDIRVRPLVPLVVASVAAGLTAAAALAALDGGPVGLVFGLSAGTLAFALLARALRIVPARDAAWLRHYGGHRARGWVGRALDACAARPEPVRP